MFPLPKTPHLTRRAGFTLIEVVLTLGVVSVAALSLIGILSATFLSARQITLQHKAINALSHLEAALSTASGVTGAPATFTTATTSDGRTISPFDRAYNTIQPSGNGMQSIDFFVCERISFDGVRKPTPASPAVYYSAGHAFPLTIPVAKEADIDTASIFRMRVRVSHLLVDKPILIDPATGNLSGPWAVGAELPAVDFYALAYLPLSVEVFPYDFSPATDPGGADNPGAETIRPILTQTIVINR